LSQRGWFIHSTTLT